MDEYVDRTTMELTSGEAVVFQKFPVKLLEHYGMVSGSIERRGGDTKYMTSKYV